MMYTMTYFHDDHNTLSSAKYNGVKLSRFLTPHNYIPNILGNAIILLYTARRNSEINNQVIKIYKINSQQNTCWWETFASHDKAQ